MDFKDFTAGKDDEKRLDKVIRKFIPQNSLSGIYKYIRKGLIKVNNAKTKPEYHIKNGDVINIASFIIEQKNDVDKKTDVDGGNFNSFQLPVLPPVIFENQHIIIFDKPYDINVQGSQDSLDKIVQQFFKTKSNKINSNTESLTFTPGPLHRLDRKTTGLIAFSKSLQGAQWFSENIKNHTIEKKYITILQGCLETKEEWNDFITKTEETDGNFHKVKATKGEVFSQNKAPAAESKNTKTAITICTPVAFGKYTCKGKTIDFTLAQMDIKTGRTHQIRSQSALHGHPLLGDTAYGGLKLPSKYPDFFLQACKLTFPPQNPLGLPQNIEIPYSAPLKSFLKDCDVQFLDI